ncbi:MAG: DUF917 domain-containing protein [Chloroflexi bacterium]|nr:DUF917 domain-containing protein [Chloroflexota bacterium]
MPTRSLKTRQECEDFVRGATFFGVGGGGPPARGNQLLGEQIDAGRVIRWVDISEIDDEAWTVCPFGMGGRPPKGHPTPEELKEAGLDQPKVSNNLQAAIEALADYMHIKIGAVVPVELGGSNTPGPLIAGMNLGIPTVDGDYTGRAIPEITQITPEIYGKRSWPLASVDRWGNVCIIKEAVGTAMAERIGKLMSRAAFGGCGMAGFLLKGREMKQIIVRDSLSKCLDMGLAIRKALAGGQDPVEAAARQGGGWVLFRGSVTATEWDESQPYMYGIGTNRIEGSGAFQGQQFAIWYKNENHITWKGGKPFVTSPDIIAVLDEQSGEPLTNADVIEGRKVAVVGLPAIAGYRSAKGLEVLGPRHFGFDIDYITVEKQVA